MGLQLLLSIWGILIISPGLLKVDCQGDSLRSALNAIDRRQRDLTYYPSRYGEDEVFLTMDRPEQIAYLKAASKYQPDHSYEKSAAVERAVLDYLDDEDRYDQEDIKKRISSSFRERVEEDKQRQMEELARSVISNLENNGEEYPNENDEEYSELVRELWNKYKHHPSHYSDAPKIYTSRNINKRYYYPKFGLDSIGLRKKSRYFNPDGPNDSLSMLNYIPRDEVLSRLQDEYDEGSTDSNYYRNQYYDGDRKVNKFNQENYSQMKRFPVTKRSSDYTQNDSEHESKLKKETDPKVAKDLSNIFGTKTTEKPTTKETEIAKATKKEHAISIEKIKPQKENKTTKATASTKEVSSATSVNEKPLQIKKKSINWSDYFGLDRRKKSQPNNELDNEWMMERYHKAISLAEKRSNNNLQLQSFRNHDLPAKKESTENAKGSYPKDANTEDQKISEMDDKLKKMEDAMVDDALKYTGAHEGTSDPQEIQEVKDEVISRLAAAYSFEKMRKALGEYRLSIAKERQRLKNQKHDDDYMFSERKRTSVPRKQAVDEEKEKMPEGDNNIKCAQGEEDCQQQNYKTPNDILESHFGNGECARIKRACNELGVYSHYGHIFEPVCYMNQMCLLCSSNSWFSPTRPCNALFLSKAYEVCDGKTECKNDATRYVKYMVDLNRSLQSEPATADDCELACPDPDVISDAFGMR